MIKLINLTTIFLDLCWILILWLSLFRERERGGEEERGIERRKRVGKKESFYFFSLKKLKFNKKEKEKEFKYFSEGKMFISHLIFVDLARQGSHLYIN